MLRLRLRGNRVGGTPLPALLHQREVGDNANGDALELWVSLPVSHRSEAAASVASDSAE